MRIHLGKLLVATLLVCSGSAVMASGGGGGGGGGGGTEEFIKKAFGDSNDGPKTKAKPAAKKTTPAKASDKKAPATAKATAAPAATAAAAAAAADSGIAACEKEFAKNLLSGCISDHLGKLAERLHERKAPGALGDAITTLQTTASGLREATSKEQALSVMEKAKGNIEAALNAMKSNAPQASEDSAANLAAISGTLGRAIGAVQRKG